MAIARSVLVAAALVLAALGPAGSASAAPALAAPGHMVQSTYTNAAGTRTYFVYEPTGGGTGKPLMVWLHGCGGPLTQQAGHALAALAEQDGFTLVYPDQDAAANVAQCWNWYQATDNQRGQGEASIIAGITTAVRDQVGADTNRVYVGGYSAGGAMSTVMGAAYPDIYAAIAPSAGAPYGLDVTGKTAATAMGTAARPMPAWFLQGVGDEISVYGPIGRGNVLQWLQTDRLVGASSAPLTPTSTGTTTWSTTYGPVPAVKESYVADGCELAQFNSDPLEHLTNGYLISNDAGLSIQQDMMTFLFAHKRGAAGVGCG